MSGTMLPQQGILLMHAVLAMISAIPAVILFASLFEGDAHQWRLTWWYFATVIMPVPLSYLATLVTSVYLIIKDSQVVKASAQTTISDEHLRNEPQTSMESLHYEVLLGDSGVDTEAAISDGPIGRLYLKQIRREIPDEATSNTTFHQRGGSWPPPYPWGKRTSWPRDEEKLPTDFTMHNTEDGGRYFTHVSDTKPIWRDPRFRTGWTKFVDKGTGKTCYVDHNNRYTTWLKPALPYLKGFDDDIFREWEKTWIRRANRFFFVNHRTGETTWKDPQRKKQPKTEFVDKSGDLPPGWEKYSSWQRLLCLSQYPNLDRELHHNCNNREGATICFLDTQTGQWTYKDPRRPEEPLKAGESPRSTRSGSTSAESIYNDIGFKQRYLAARYTRLYALLSAIFLFAQGGIAVTLALRLRLNTGVNWLIFVPWIPVLTGIIDLGVTLTCLFFFFGFGPPTVDAMANHLSCLAWIASSAAMAYPVAVKIVSMKNLRPKDMAQDEADDYLRVTQELIKWLLVASCLSTLTMGLWIWHGYAFGRYRR
ncbi:hypothetical protein B0J15DRAFT_469596 [Fusarium solani]|uniref:WW domain-containing protein n=1 Tax=Fusarium solani TaxID=169388 RepID=A0A9P9GTC7_FUSSL|nr:uncharacterized protein B0J15DRAFT_469596 [Fusarium solani]KAH7244936.1 hypothetical protein B0J15DRAFT_469596 [Fusarium solani]